MWLLTLKSILVATDLDEASKPALRTAARLAPLAGASLHLLHVAAEPSRHDRDRLRAYFRDAVPDAPEPDGVEVIVGSPADAIVEYAGLVGADAVILGPHRDGGVAGEMGSTAAQVVHAAPCPCLVAARELNLPLERVVAPIDLSEIAGGALSVAISWASALRPRGAEANLTALHLAPVPASPTVDREVHEEVQRARSRAGGAAHVQIHEKIAPGREPAEGILHEAAAARADLLVMGTRGATDAAAGLGSVSAAVARATPCPLLLVPPATWEEQGAEP
jgi:nucleotide-binding universal stress UspA family protein